MFFFVCGGYQSFLPATHLARSGAFGHSISLVGNVGDMSPRHVGVVSCRLISSRHPNVADIVTGIVGESRVG